jgi:hypothetical protein
MNELIEVVRIIGYIDKWVLGLAMLSIGLWLGYIVGRK